MDLVWHSVRVLPFTFRTSSAHKDFNKVVRYKHWQNQGILDYHLASMAGLAWGPAKSQVRDHAIVFRCSTLPCAVYWFKVILGLRLDVSFHDIPSRKSICVQALFTFRPQVEIYELLQKHLDSRPCSSPHSMMVWPMDRSVHLVFLHDLSDHGRSWERLSLYEREKPHAVRKVWWNHKTFLWKERILFITTAFHYFLI